MDVYHCFEEKAMCQVRIRPVLRHALYATTPKSKQWSQVAQFFRNQPRLKWTTIRLMTNGNKRKRMEFRIRHTKGYLRYVGQVASEDQPFNWCVPNRENDRRVAADTLPAMI
jgi:hypothetical protein